MQASEHPSGWRGRFEALLMRSTFGRQLNVTLMGAIFCLALFTSILTSVQEARLVRQMLVTQGERIADELAARSRLALLYSAGENASEAITATLSFPDVTLVRIFDAQGRLVVARRRDALAGPDASPALPPLATESASLETETDRAWRFVAPVRTQSNNSPFDVNETPGQVLGYVQVEQSKAPLLRMVRAVVLGNFTLALLLAVPFLALTRALGSRLSRPLDALSAAMARAEEGDRNVRADVKGPRDIAAMAHAFNRMMHRLQEREEDLQRHRANLEVVVQQRTVELLEAKERAEVASLAKTDFLARMSHELRSPLNAMLGFSRVLLRNQSLDAIARHDAGIVLASGEHLYALINEVLNLSKIEAGRVTLQITSCDVFGLLDELEEMYALVARDKGLELSVQAAADVPPHVELDAVKLRQVLANLLSNAIKFTSRGGVTLDVWAAAESRLGFAVRDTGVGISPEELPQIGQAFTQAQAGRQAAEGTGLGLAISRSFVQLMGGQLTLTSEPGRGTRVAFELPVIVLPQASPGTDAPAAAPPPCRILRLVEGTPAPRVLAVDDWPESRQLLVRLLEPLGFQVREAADGQQAIDVWQEWQPALILMDIRMPVMDGREATRRIKATEQGRKTVVIALTASSFEEQRDEILALGCNDFLRKPFQEQALLEMMALHLNLQYEFDAPLEAPTVPAPDAERLAILPAPMREQLRHALTRLDVQSVLKALDDIRAHDAGLAATLAPMIERFEYERVDELLGAAGGAGGASG